MAKDGQWGTDFRTSRESLRQAQQSDVRPRSVNQRVLRSDDAIFEYDDDTITPKDSRSITADIVADLITIATTLTVDGEATQGLGIIESGSNSDGNYVVFSSGLQVCWGLRESANLPMTTATLGWYRSDSVVSVTWPQAFNIAPYALATGEDNSSPVAKPAEGEVYSTTADFYLYRGSSATADASFYWIAIGEAG